MPMTKVMALAAAAAAALILGGCATTDAGHHEDFVGGKCKAEPGQTFVGQRATVATGAGIQKVTGSAILRWAPPNSALTMDFREERVTVAYDKDMVIERVTCG
ncbi:I78 family peptidase inhibitor [Altererythrobacter sp. Root672]|uniref:I78 family peptidase inhibitor n=1 Tax=Altererythrobacter sp. Root672 TaxID=1736584 RepID=UPI000B1A59F8|nr:I78 family peptidase inhibitor [Altererythrobacter sp. Root672]